LSIIKTNDDAHKYYLLLKRPQLPAQAKILTPQYYLISNKYLYIYLGLWLGRCCFVAKLFNLPLSASQIVAEGDTEDSYQVAST